MSDILYHTNYLDLKSTPAKNGKPWVYAHRPNAKDVVVIVPATDDEVLFLIEERPPIQAENRGKYAIGLVAGLVGDERENESIENALKTELLEEVGLVAENIVIKAKNVASSAGCVSETFVIAIAKISDKKVIQKPISDNGVIVDRIWVKKKDIKNWLTQKEAEGYVLTSQALAALFYLFE